MQFSNEVPVLVTSNPTHSPMRLYQTISGKHPQDEGLEERLILTTIEMIICMVR